MYQPAGHRTPNLALLWPALVAASACEMAAFAAKQFSDLAVGCDGSPNQQQKWASPHTVTLGLETVQLRDFSTPSLSSHASGAVDGRASFPALLCAPLALHGAAVCDLVAGHSLVAALRNAGLTRLFVTDWRSATAQMRFLGIDEYLADLNVLVDEIGAPVDLIGLCQGGWMALIYAARFPDKVRKLVLAAAPIDIAAASSALSALTEASPLAVFHELVRLGDGLMPGRSVTKFWGPETVDAENIRDLLQTKEAIGSATFTHLEALFRDWYSWTLDLPGRYFLEVVERLYKHNELATGNFMALGQRVDLATLRTPIFLLAARDDELVAPEQLFAVEHLVGTEPHSLRKATAPCRHVGLFMGKRILKDVWPRIAHWISEPSTISAEYVGGNAQFPGLIERPPNIRVT